MENKRWSKILLSVKKWCLHIKQFEEGVSILSRSIQSSFYGDAVILT